MKGKHTLLFVVALLSFAVLMTAGNAGAKYVGDNATPDGAGGWSLPVDKGFCNTGIKRDGTMNIDLSVGNNRNDCIAKLWPAYTTQAACLASDAAGANVEGSHFWSSACVAPDGVTGISLNGLDRTRFMCEQKGGTYKLACNSSWTAMGPTWSASPVSQSQGGTDGFCYTRIRLAGYTLATCPVPTAGSPGTGTLGYAWNATGGYCTYAYGIQGIADQTLNFKDGIAPAFVTAGNPVNLSGLTQGQCLANGASFSNHTLAAGFVPDPVDSASTIASPITQVRTGCLSCHNTTTQYNSMSGRWKSDYLKTGHKNMLRKVTPGIPWAGADGAIYTEAAASQDINFFTGEITSPTLGTRPLMYLFGDWMAPAPEGLDTIVWMSNLNGARYNGTSTYSCAPCHSTGWSNPSAGICVVGSVAKTSAQIANSGACTTAGGKWYPMSGAQSMFDYTSGGPTVNGAYLGTYQPAQPGASWLSDSRITVNADNSINGITGRWDWDGITCNRCHKVSYDPSFPINDQGVHAAPGHTTHETDIFDGWACVKTCFGCHQSPAFTNNGLGLGGQNEVDLNNPTGLQVKNNKTWPAYQPEFNSHPIGQEFLNSPHARFTGTMVPNSLGKYDLLGGTNASAFVGKLCRSSTAPAGGNILETMADGSTIKTLADCNRANGKAIGDTTNYGFWQNESGDAATSFEGSCITCHNVHDSLFVADAKEPMKRECTTCHTDQATPAGDYPTLTKVNYFNHPGANGTGSAGTPFQNSSALPSSSCETCHMPKATSGGFPMHMWRINPSEAYRTFPTAAEFGATPATGTNRLANASPDGTYTQAVWVDVDYACGQCHGGGPDEANAVYAPAERLNASAPYRNKAYLAAAAVSMHIPMPKANFYFMNDSFTNRQVNFDASPTICPDGFTCTYSWDFGDGSPAGSGLTTSHVYATCGATPSVTLTVTSDGGTGTKSQTVSPVNVSNAAPTASGLAARTVSGLQVSFTDTSTDAADNCPNGFNAGAVSVVWGDGQITTHNQGAAISHTYAAAGAYSITHSVRDKAGLMKAEGASVTLSNPSLNITANTSSALSGVTMILKLNGSTKQVKTTDGTGAVTFTGVANVSGYTVQAYKSGVVFDGDAGTAGNQNPVSVSVGGTATFTHTP